MASALATMHPHVLDRDLSWRSGCRQFPERRSRNLPVITQLTVTDDRAADIPAALERWPLLKGYTISPAIAVKALPAFRY